MKRYLEVKKVSTLTYQVVKQTHRNSEFTPEGFQFNSKKGCKLASSALPAKSMGNSRLIFVRGDIANRDNNKIIFKSSTEERDFLVAVKEYNKLYGGISCKCLRAIVCKDCMKDLEEVLNF